MLTITVSTYCTFLRILLTPFIVGKIFCQQWLYASILFFIAAITDFLDGFIARRFNQETQLGKMLDPVADKILLTSVFVALGFVQLAQSVPVWFLLFLLGKELLLIVGGALLYSMTQSTLSPSPVAKWVTALEMIFIVFVMLQQTGYGMIIQFHESIWWFFVMSFTYILTDYAVQAYQQIKKT